MNSQAFSKIWIVVILLAFIAGGILAWQYFGVPKEEAGVPEEIAKDETTDWKTYRNEVYGFEFEYPRTLELASASEEGGLVPFDPLITSNVYVIQPDSKEVIFSVMVRGNEVLTPTWVAMQSDALKPATLRPSPVAVIVAGMSGYKIAKGTIAITTDFPQGTKYVSNQYFLQKASGPIFNLVIPGDSGDQILSTFKFIEVTTEGLPEEIRNNQDFIEWIEDWQVVKPSYVADTFTKVSENGFSLNGEPINQEELEDAIKEIQSPYLPEERRKLYYSPDRTKFIFNAGYPDPLEIDQDVVLFDLSTNKYQHLKTCGTACWFEKVFWINNNQFVVIRTGEYSFTEEYEHSISLYDLEKNTVMEYKSSEKISTEDLKKK